MKKCLRYQIEDIERCAMNGDLATMLELMKDTSNEWIAKSNALIYAASYGHIECVKKLLHCQGLDNNKALLGAVRFNHLDCVTFLIPLSDPALNSSLPLRMASFNNRAEAFDLLYPHSNPQEALHQMHALGEREEVYMLEQRIAADAARAEIEKHMPDKSIHTKKKIL